MHKEIVFTVAGFLLAGDGLGKVLSLDFDAGPGSGQFCFGLRSGNDRWRRLKPCVDSLRRDGLSLRNLAGYRDLRPSQTDGRLNEVRV